MNDSFFPPDSSGQASGQFDERMGRLRDELDAEGIFVLDASPGETSCSVVERVGTCPDVGIWIELATQKSSGTRTEDLLAHAALCPECLSKLRMGLRILDARPIEEEKGDLLKLSSGSAQWQRSIAAELALTPKSVRGARRSTTFLSISCAIAAVLVGAVFILWERDRTPERLLADAYSQNRVFDLRIVGAAYAPLNAAKQVRGLESGQTNFTLTAARTQIDRELKKAPTDRRWLQLKARTAILDEQYDEAVTILDRLLAGGPVTESLLLDAGSAYFLRGTVSGGGDDRTQALDFLRHADEMAPENATVLFDEAVVMEDCGRFGTAVETWNRYLKVETDPRWLAEGDARLRALKDRVDRRAPN